MGYWTATSSILSCVSSSWLSELGQGYWNHTSWSSLQLQCQSQTIQANYMPSDGHLQQLEFIKPQTHRGFTKTFETLILALTCQGLFLQELLNDDPTNEITNRQKSRILWGKLLLNITCWNQHWATLFEATEALDLQSDDAAKKKPKSRRMIAPNGNGNGKQHQHHLRKQLPHKCDAASTTMILTLRMANHTMIPIVLAGRQTIRTISGVNVFRI